MSTINLKAGLSKDGQRVICGMRDCGVTLALIMEPKPDRLEKAPFVWFPPGWVWQRDGTWTVSVRARGRLRRGKTPEAKHVPGSGVRPTRVWPEGWVPYLPAMARCWNCNLPQVLDAGVLNVCHDKYEGPRRERDKRYHTDHGFLRELFSPDELERWEREHLRIGWQRVDDGTPLC